MYVQFLVFSINSMESILVRAARGQFWLGAGVSEHFVGIRALTLAAALLITLHHEHLIIYTVNSELDSIAAALFRNMVKM